jgi:hypothetical protein
MRSIKRIEDREVEECEGEDKDMIRRVVQIKRKLKVKGKKGPVLSEGVKTKRRKVKDKDTKSQSKREKNGNLPALFIVEFIAHISRAS